MRTSIRGGRVLLADGRLVDADLLVEDRHIAVVGAVGESAPGWDARGLLVLPGIVDLHGDAFERQLMPRPRVMFPVDVALLDTDRQLAANGVTTAYHGLTWSWEPGLRGRDAALAFVAALERLRPHLSCDTRLHLRFETHALEAVGEVEQWLEAGRVDLLAFNDHVALISDKAAKGGLAKYADRAHLPVAGYQALLDSMAERAPLVPAAIERLAAAARRHTIPMASHDDATPEVRRSYHGLGCRLCEFPTTIEAAETARALGDVIILGAPNVVRGGSHAGRLDAAAMVRGGMCSALASDYYYPALLQAALVLARDGAAGFAASWALLSAQPAAAVGLDDRGEIGEGKRADLVLVDPGEPARIVATFVAGVPVHVVGTSQRRCVP